MTSSRNAFKGVKTPTAVVTESTARVFTAFARVLLIRYEINQKERESENLILRKNVICSYIVDDDHYKNDKKQPLYWTFESFSSYGYIKIKRNNFNRKCIFNP